MPRTVLLFAALLVPLLGGEARAQVRPRLRAHVVERQLGGREVHAFPIQMEAGEFLGIVVEQDRVDTIVELSGPLGEKVLTMDSPDFWWWEEELAVVAERSGTYLLTVQPFYIRNLPPGFYRMRIDGPRAPRGEDRLRIEAVREMRAAHVFRARKEGEKELAHLEKALHLWQTLGERRREAETLHQIVETQAGLGQKIAAAGRFHQALSLWQELGLDGQRAWTLLENSRGDKNIFPRDQARAHMEEALELAGRVGSPFLELRILLDLGLFHAGEPRTAAPYLKRAVRLARESGNRDMEMRCLYQLGYALDDLAEKQEAMRLYEQALALSRELGDRGVQANALNSLGHLYTSLGHWEKAAEHLRQSIELSRQIRDAKMEAAALNNLAVVYERLDPSRAREPYEQALTLGRESGDREIQARAMSNLAYLDQLAGNPSGALERCRAALELTEGDPAAEAQVRYVAGMIHRRLGDLAASRRELQAALELSRRRQDRVHAAQVIAALARTERMAGDLPAALALLDEGVRLLESLRTEVVQEELRATFLASRQATYQLHVDTLMDLHRAQPDRGWDAEALRASERARARALLDILAQAGADVGEGADPALAERERRLLAEIEALERDRLKLLGLPGKGAGSPEVREVTARLAAALEEHGEVEAELRESSPRYAALTQPQPVTVDEIRREVLDGRALLLEYDLGEEASYLWAVTPDGLSAFVLPPRAKIEEAARRWYGALQVHPRDEGGARAAEEARKAADELSEMLLGPVQGMLSGQPLLVVGDGALQYLPFGALPSPASLAAPVRVPLIAGQQVVSLPSASTLAVLRRELAERPPAPKALAVLADPVFRPEDPRVALARRSREEEKGTPASRRGLTADSRATEVNPRRLPRLSFSGDEAEAIAALVPESERFTALGFYATRAVATGGKLAHYRIVHFATHGLIDSVRPELSSLVLSLVDERGEPQNGFLRLHDVYNLDLQADLVVLSACQTALGQEIRGEGLVGLTRGFMYAGAARVLASLWSVDDRATSILMERFYRHMISGHMSPAEALRQAQVEMSRDPRWSSPYYWAAFSLQGEWD